MGKSSKFLTAEIKILVACSIDNKTFHPCKTNKMSHVCLPSIAITSTQHDQIFSLTNWIVKVSSCRQQSSWSYLVDVQNDWSLPGKIFFFICWLIVGHPEPEKKILLAFLSTFWHPCSKCILMCFKKDRGGCQVWKCPKVPELGQRSTECKFLYICQILAFLSIRYAKL